MDRKTTLPHSALEPDVALMDIRMPHAAQCSVALTRRKDAPHGSLADPGVRYQSVARPTVGSEAAWRCADLSEKVRGEVRRVVEAKQRGNLGHRGVGMT